jgi:hypothetical protein
MTLPTIIPKPTWVESSTAIKTFLQKDVVVRYQMTQPGESGYLPVDIQRGNTEAVLIEQWAPVGGANG